jgi:hypothetical protein
MESLAKEFAGKVDFYVLYVREAHPGENYPAQTSFEEKLQHARDLKRLEDIGTRTILVDELQGTMHNDYGSRPNSVYVIGRDGIILFRADWNAPQELETQLNRLVEKNGFASGLEAVDLTGNFTSLTPKALVEQARVFRRAGYGAMVDFVVSAWNLRRTRGVRPAYNRAPSLPQDASQLRP